MSCRGTKIYRRLPDIVLPACGPPDTLPSIIMSASNAQQTVERRESVNDAKLMKPPIKPKPTVPPKPKQVSVSTNSETKSPLLSPNFGGPCSPTFDIPSAFKISQLTGPQPYGARRTSLKRWSSSVGEEVLPESNSLLSPVENVVPELSTKVTNQPLAAALKPLQTGSVWKGKSPFMLTTRGWGEQKSQGKDTHESASFSQKHSFSSASKNADLKEKETVLEGNTVINSNSPFTFMSTEDHKGVDINVQDLKQSLSNAPEEVEKTSSDFTSSGKLNKKEMPAEDNEIKRSQESSSQLSVSPQTDLYFGTAKQSTQYEHSNQDTTTEDFSFKGGQVTTEFPEDMDGAFMQLKNTSVRTKDYEEPQLISLVPTAMPKENVLVTENTDNPKTIDESSSSDKCKSTNQEVNGYHEDHSNDISEVITVIKDEQDDDSGYLQTLQSQFTFMNQNTEQTILGNLEQVEKHAISSGAQITHNPVTENEIYKNIPLEDKESTDSVEHNLLHTAEHCDLHEIKTQVASDDNNKPYTYQEDKKTVAPTDMQPPVCTVRSYEIFSEGQQNTSTQIHDYNIEEEQDQFKNREDEYATIQSAEYVPHQTSKVFEKQTDNPEYRSVFGTDAKSPYDYKTHFAPDLPEHEDNETSSDLYVGSQILENDSLIPGEVYSPSVGESKEPSYSYVEMDTQPGKPQEELSQLESYETSKPEQSYDESEFRYSEITSQDPAARVIQPEELSDHYEQLARPEYYAAYSPKQNKCEVNLDKLECRSYESNMQQYTHSQSQEQECSYTHTVELDDKQSEELFHTHGQPEEPDYKYQQLEKLDDKNEQSDKPSYMYEQIEETVQRSKLSKEPGYTSESEESDLKYEQTGGSGHRNQELEHSTHKYEHLEEPSYRCEKLEEIVLRDDQPEEHVYGYKPSDKPVGRYGQSEHLLQSYQQPKTIDDKHEQSEEPVHRYEEAVQKYVHSEDPVNKYEQSDESQHQYAYLASHECEQLEDPGRKNKQLDKLTDKYEQTEQPVWGYHMSEKSIHKCEASKVPVNIYEQGEAIIHSHDQSQEPDHIYKQHDEPVYSYELVDQYGQIEDPGYNHTGTDAKHSECSQSGLIHLGSLQQQYKPVQLEEIDSMPHISTVSCEILESSERDLRSRKYLEQQLNDSYMEESEYNDTSTNDMHDTKITVDQVPKSLPSEEQQLLSVHKEETQQCLTESEEAQHIDGFSEGSTPESLTITKVESDECMPEETQDQEAKTTNQILNEHGELQTVDYTSDAAQEIQAEEPEPSVDNFDFLEGTVVLDSAFMRGKASLGKKRGHRTPAGTCGSEEKDPEYWLFIDSTEPKCFSETHSEEEDRDETSPDGTPDNSPPPVKSPNKKGIFAGIISPSLLKGRLKTRSKTTEDETVRPEVEESKSPGKEKPESPSHSLSWLYALKKKKKSSKETTKEEKKKQSK